MEVIAEAADGEQGIQRACQLRPNDLDLVLMDIQMPKLDGIETSDALWPPTGAFLW